MNFKTLYVNPSRRDLIKHLLALGCMGTAATLQPALVFGRESKDISAQSAGKLTWKDSSDYEALRQALVWRINTPARYPDVIVQAENAQEVQSAIQFATQHNLQVVCRSSGHNLSGAVLRNGGMLLDVSALASIKVDKKKMTAKVGPGLTMYRCYQHLFDQGLIFPVAECHGVAMGGYLLGGGFVPVGQSWSKGPACYAVLGAKVILASGEEVVVNQHENPDLFWALRGAGPGFFGVVTEFHIRLFPHPRTIMKSEYEYSDKSLAAVIAILDQLHTDRDERVNINIKLTQASGPAGSVTAKLHLTAATDQGGEKEARSLLKPYAQGRLARLAQSRKEHQVLLYENLMYTPDRNFRVISDNIWTNDAAALLATVEHYRKRPEGAELLNTFYHGHQSDELRSDACYSARGAHYASNHLLWKDAALDNACINWYEELNEVLAPYVTSHYVNQVDSEHHPGRIRESFSDEAWRRLAMMRRAYDPGDLFHTYLGHE